LDIKTGIAESELNATVLIWLLGLNALSARQRK
jgi:hypothetical protein